LQILYSDVARSAALTATTASANRLGVKVIKHQKSLKRTRNAHSEKIQIKQN